MKTLLIVTLVLVGCGSSKNNEPATEATYTDAQSIALVGDTSGTYKSDAVLTSAAFKDCAFTVHTADLKDLTTIDGHTFKQIVGDTGSCTYYMSIEGLLTRSVKICSDHAEVNITCHQQ